MMYTEPKAKKGQNSCQESTKKGKNRVKKVQAVENTYKE
jgi:hypothetical protein